MSIYFGSFFAPLLPYAGASYFNGYGFPQFSQGGVFSSYSSGGGFGFSYGWSSGSSPSWGPWERMPGAWGYYGWHPVARGMRAAAGLADVLGMNPYTVPSIFNQDLARSEGYYEGLRAAREARKAEEPAAKKPADLPPDEDPKSKALADLLAKAGGGATPTVPPATTVPPVAPTPSGATGAPAAAVPTTASPSTTAGSSATAAPAGGAGPTPAPGGSSGIVIPQPLQEHAVERWVQKQGQKPGFVTDFGISFDSSSQWMKLDLPAGESSPSVTSVVDEALQQWQENPLALGTIVIQYPESSGGGSTAEWTTSIANPMMALSGYGVKFHLTSKATDKSGELIVWVDGKDPDVREAIRLLRELRNRNPHLLQKIVLEYSGTK